MIDSLDTWEADLGFDIFGAGSSEQVNGIMDGEPDGVNEVLFSDYPNAGIAAVTTVWFTPLPPREFVEWGTLFDTDYSWSFDDSYRTLDSHNVAAHEAGHGIGMGQPYDSCTEETMYRWVVLNETKKRDLHTGDKEGIKKLYRKYSCRLSNKGRTRRQPALFRGWVGHNNTFSH